SPILFSTSYSCVCVCLLGASGIVSYVLDRSTQALQHISGRSVARSGYWKGSPLQTTETGCSVVLQRSNFETLSKLLHRPAPRYRQPDMRFTEPPACGAPTRPA